MHTRRAPAVLSSLTAAALVVSIAANGIAAQSRNSESQAPNTTKPIKVYILAAQSNM